MPTLQASRITEAASGGGDALSPSWNKETSIREGKALEMPKSNGIEITQEGSRTCTRRCYSRSELEAWRHVDPERQQSSWGEIYLGLDSDVALEYDGISDSAPTKQMGQSVSRRQKAKLKKVQQATTSPNGMVVEMPKTTGIEITGEGSSRCSRRYYSRSELEAWRHINPEQQRNLWDEIYGGLCSAVASEYDDLLDSTPPKQVGRNEGRRQKATKKKEFVPDDGSTTASNAPQYKHVADFGVEKDAPKVLPYSDVDEACCRENSFYVEEPYCEEYEEEEEDDDDDEVYSIQRPAFLVEGEPDFESGPPQDGLEYLRRVRWEAAQIPRVTVARVEPKKHSEQTPYMPEIPEIQKCPELLLPMKAWEDAFLQDFSELRLSFSRFESFRVSHSLPMLSSLPTALQSQPNQPTDLPTLSKILATTAVSRASLLIKRIEEFEGEDRLSREYCLWLFALCAVVDTPLYAELSASIRSLLRKCSSLLASRSDPNDEEVAMLNILVTITGKYFGQSEEGRF